MTLVAEDIGVSLGRRQVVRGISFAAGAGEFVGVLGPNGAGKSSLLRAILGLLPASGRVLLDAVSRDRLSRAAIARRMAYLPQGQLLHWPIAVERLVALGRLPHLSPWSSMGDADRHAVERTMAEAEVGDLRDRIATELSGGERSRVLLARALAVEAPILFADEPLASLDPAHQLHVMEILRRTADAGTLIVAVLHDLAMAARFCDRVLLVRDGALVADGTPGDVLTPLNLASVFGITAAFSDGRPTVPLARLTP